MTALQVYAILKKHISESLIGAGALKGANATIKKIERNADDNANIVTFEWTANDGTTRTSTMTVKDGVAADSVEVETYYDDGVKLATIKLDDTDYEIYCPEEAFDNSDYEIIQDAVDLPNDLTSDDRKIYFCVNDGHSYLWDGTKWDIIRSDAKVVELTQAEYDALSSAERLNGTIYFVTDGQASGGGGGTSAELSADLTATKTVGGVSVGNSFPLGTSLETVLRRILAPALYPTFTNPSASLSATGAKLLEIGATQATTFTVTFSRGSISPAYGTSGYRSGAATSYQLNGGTAQSTNTFTETVDGTTTTYKATVTYGAGDQPLDSEGNNYSSALAAGSLQSNQITFEFVNPLYANTSSIATVAKLALVSKSAKQKDLVFPAQTVANPEIFDVPASWTVTAIQVKNDLSGAFEDASDQFTVTNTTHDDAAGNSVNYKRYEFNLGYDTGSRTVRIKWN